DRKRRRELLSFFLPIHDDRRRDDDERGLPALLLLRLEEHAERLHRLAEAHFVGERAAERLPIREPEPLETALLVRSQRLLERRRRLASSDAFEALEFLDELT